MLKLLTCPRGHSWEAVAEDDAAAARAVCPVCGAAVDDDLPLLEAVTTDAPPPADAPRPLLQEDAPLRDAGGRPNVAGFDILEDLGRAPTGVLTFKAKQVLVNRVVALKVVVARDDPGQAAWGALRGEASALGRISHPHVVQIHEAGERDRQLFYNAVEWVEGSTLARCVGGEPPTHRQAARLVETLARTVQYAHEQGVVHRALRPGCVLLQARGRGPEDRPRNKGQTETPEPTWCEIGGGWFLPKLTDFGLARRPVEGEPNDAELQGGLPAYLSPEQAWGRTREIGPGSDVYALGAVLYALLAGEAPYRGRTPGATVDYIRAAEPPPPPRLSPRHPLYAVCRRAMHRQPKLRYPSARDLADDLRRYLDARPVRARPAGLFERVGLWARRRPALAVLLLLGLVALGLTIAASVAAAARAAADQQRYEEALKDVKRYQEESASKDAKLTQVQQRDKQAAYFRSILLADRAIQAQQGDRAKQLLDECDPALRQWEWFYLNRTREVPDQARSLPLTDRDPKHPINRPAVSLAFAPDGGRVAVAFSDGALGSPSEVRVWNLARPDQPEYFSGFAGPLRQVVFSPDGTRLATAGSVSRDGFTLTGEVRVWKPEALPNDPFTGPEQAAGVAFSLDGGRLAVLTDHGKLHVYDNAGAGAEVPPGFPADPGGAFNSRPTARVAALDKSGTKWAAVSADGLNVRLLEAGRSQPPLPSQPTRSIGITKEILCLAFSPEANLLAVGGRDQTVQLFDPTGKLDPNSKPVATCKGHNADVTCASFSRDGKRLATAGADGTVKVWDPATGVEILSINTGPAGAPAGVQFSPAKDDWRLATCRDKEVRVYGPPPNRPGP